VRIGLDFDNTIVCYDEAIAVLANEMFSLPSDLPSTKLALRDYLKREQRESEWTIFQGALYGPGMNYANPFPHAIEAMRCLATQGHSLHIISHRSVRPYAGPNYDLHASARHWIETTLQPEGLFLDGEVYFYETRESKISAIEKVRCQIFLDDLPEVLDDAMFPIDTIGLWFFPDSTKSNVGGKRVVRIWSELPSLINELS
jgi:hypothetical protein